MYGRSCVYLLAFFALVLAPALLRSQARRIGAPPDLAVRSLQTAVPRELIQPRTCAAACQFPGALDFPQVVRAAGTIFSGTVTSIARHPATRGQAVETVAITFHIENAIRGATSGEDLTVLQWIGLWSGGQRYRLCERVLLFLYPPSKLGLTSCVAGSVGRFTIDAQGRILLSAQHLSAFRSSPILRGKSRLRLRPWRPSRFTSDK
jgi:hypothetical protein